MSITKRLEEHQKLMAELKVNLQSVVKSTWLLYNRDLEEQSDSLSYALGILTAERDRLAGLLALAGVEVNMGDFNPPS